MQGNSCRFAFKLLKRVRRPLIRVPAFMNKSYLIALIIFVTIAAWMASGLLAPPNAIQTSLKKSVSEQRQLVKTQTQVAQAVQLQLTVQGQAEPNREVMVRSDIAGRIEKIVAEEGQAVQEGGLLAQLDMEDRQIRLEKEQAMLRSRKQAYTRSQALAAGKFQSKQFIEESFAALKSAEANVARIELEIDRTQIRAPFDGIVDQYFAEKGGYVAPSSQVLHFVDIDPLIVVVPVAQQEIQKLTKNSMTLVNFATGEQREGRLRFIAPKASESTRTFRVEIAVDNQDHGIPAGISAEVKIPVKRVVAHFVSPAILTLGASGQIGLKTVDEDNTVEFYPVSIVQAQSDGVWVQGLPEKARIIVVGQGFVSVGSQVEVLEAPDAVQHADNSSTQNTGAGAL